MIRLAEDLVRLFKMKLLLLALQEIVHLQILKEDAENSQPNHQQQQSSPSPSYSPKMSPYMPHHYRPYERLSSTNNSPYEMKHPRYKSHYVITTFITICYQTLS